jgi:hypothetical protein
LYVALSVTVQESEAVPVVTAVPVALSVAVVPPAATVNVYDVTVSMSVNPVMLAVQDWPGNAVAVFPETFARSVQPDESGGCTRSDVVPICQMVFSVIGSVWGCPAQVNVSLPEVGCHVPMNS